jgi:DNA-directed RNA polymerase subunit RPC12/RpoP
MSANERVKVTIRCKMCGERFVLKGRKDKGKIDTGFKQCVCSNEKDFEIEAKDF